MSGHIKNVRTLINTAITARKAASGFVYNGFSIENSHVPTAKQAEASSKAGIVFLVGLISNDLGQLSRKRPPPSLREIYLNVGFIRSDVDPQDIDLVDDMIELGEQLRDTCRAIDNEIYAWKKNVAMSFDEGTPYNYVGLREIRSFEAYFTAHYIVTLN
jgi:hypothetical protein